MSKQNKKDAGQRFVDALNKGALESSLKDPNDNPNRLLTLRQVSLILNVHPNTLRKWDKKGILKAVRFGERKDRRYLKKDIENYISHNKK